MDLYVAGPHVLVEANRVLGDVQEEGFKAVDALDANGDPAGILGIPGGPPAWILRPTATPARFWAAS